MNIRSPEYTITGRGGLGGRKQEVIYCVRGGTLQIQATASRFFQQGIWFYSVFW